MKAVIHILTFTMFAFFSNALDAFTIISNSGHPAYWPTHHASYHFNTTASGYFKNGVDASGTATDEFQPIRNAFHTWMNLPGMNFSITEDSPSSQAAQSGDHTNTISWVPAGWGSLSFRPPPSALAVTLLSFDASSGAISDADIYFNATDFKWAVVDSSLENDYIDVQNIATHEIGHFLGLDHSSESYNEDDLTLADATMYYASSRGETSRRDLHPDDENAILSLYGSSDRGVVSISSVELLSSTSKVLQYKISGAGFNEYTSFVLTKHSSNQPDVVARYRTVISSSEALVEFDAAGMSGGDADVIGFNDPAHISRVGVQLDSTILGATSASGGGGGCTIQMDDHSFGWMGVLISFFAFAFIFQMRAGYATSTNRRRRHH